MKPFFAVDILTVIMHILESICGVDRPLREPSQCRFELAPHTIQSSRLFSV